MEIIMEILEVLSYIAPFVLLCIATRKVNLNPADRGYQFLMPVVALIYCIVTLIFADVIGKIFLGIIMFLANYIPKLAEVNWYRYMNYIFNTGLITVFLVLKACMLPILKRTWEGSQFLMENTSGHFYEYDEDIDKWVLQKEKGQVKFFCTGIYYCALAASMIIFVASQVHSELPLFKATFYPVFGLIVLGEVINYLSGLTKSEFVEDILGEDEDSFKIANYGLLRGVLRDLFGDRVLYDTTTDNGLDGASAFDTLDEMCKSDDPTINNLGKYFTALKEGGKNIDPSYVKSCVNLVQGQSTLFCNPFYRDLTDYMMFPMIKQLMRYQKCLVIMGRDSSTEDVKAWLEQGIYENVHTDTLWKVEILSREMTEADIAIIKFCDLYNLEIQKANEEFLSRVGFVFIVEPSKLLTTGQMGLSLLIKRFNKKDEVVYSACDRNCDGLVDALSHTLKTNITEVTATTQSAGTTSVMCWEADGEYMHHKIFSNVSRYMGVGTEINAVAMKYQIANTAWISSEKFPVLDMKWIAGQYYKKICKYANLPTSQDAFEKAFHVESNLWNLCKQKNSFMVVEDEFQNLFEMTRLFSTRARQQGFINVISENYLLRDYMLNNVQTFLTDPKAIPTIVADYSRTERNTVLKLIMRMAEDQISEDDIIQELEISGIDYQDPFEILKELIYKHCFVDEINIRVFFREKLMPDALRSEVKKYYSIEAETEIARYAENLKNAYYIAEDEKGQTYHIGAKLYGHIFQSLVPGQFLTHAGKYYEVQSITPQNGVVVRRAADHITGRKYYRQIRHLMLTDWRRDENVGGQKTISDIRIEKGYCQIKVDTDGYLEMQSCEDLKTAKKIHVSGIPQRAYRNKLVMKLNLPGASENVRYTICLLLNEIFRTTYPDSYQYICAVTPLSLEQEMPDNMKYAMYTVESDSDKEAIYIVEDSEIDLGLIISVERNIKRYFEIITEILKWHDMKMNEKPDKETDDHGIIFDPNAEEENAEVIEKEGFFKRLLRKIKTFLGKIFKKKPKIEETSAEEESEEETAVEETEVEEAPVEETTAEEASVEGITAEEASVEGTTAEETAVEEITVEETASKEAEIAGTEEVTDAESTEKAAESSQDENIAQAEAEISEAKTKTVLKNTSFILRDINSEQNEEDVEIKGQDEELEIPPTEYQKNCFLKYGYDEFDSFLDLKGAADYLTEYGYDKNPLSQVRDKEKEAEQHEKVYDPHKAGAHFCDFCGVELIGGEYELLKDGRERCNQCSVTALRTGEEFKKVFKTVMRNMEMFYGIKFNVAIKVRMTDAKTIARHFGEEFVATPGFDGRTLGFAQKDSTGYSIYVESGSPKLAAMATIAHELTHIWQYQNWDDRQITQKYGANKKLEIYEGMAKWAEIQYLMCLNEVSYAKRQEIITMMRNDVYGRGFIRFRANYPLRTGGILTGPTPFNNTEEPLTPAYLGAITGDVPYAGSPAAGGSGKKPIRRAKKGGKLKKLLLIVAVAALVVFLLQLITGKDEETVNTSSTVVDDLADDVTDDAVDDTTDDTQKKQGNIPYYAYAQLSEDEKKVYDAVYEAISNFEPELTALPIEISVDDYFKIEECIDVDHPELFWHRGGNTAYSDQMTGVVKNVEIMYCMTQEEAQKRQVQIDAVVDPFLETLNESMSDYEITKAAYEFIISSIDYDTVTMNEQEASWDLTDCSYPDDIRSIYGVFVNKKAVCVGYVKAMQYILQHFERECAQVWNEDHAWNLIKMGDHYYYVDATWGDGSNTLPEKDVTDRVSYDFLGLTTTEIQNLEDHTIENNIEMPQCTSTEYNYHYQEGLVIDTYNYDKIKTIVQEELQTGNYYVTIKLVNKQIYDECMNHLVNSGQMSQMITEVNAALGKNVNTSYTYYKDERLYTLGFELTDM